MLVARRNSEWLPSFLDEIFDNSFFNTTKNAPAFNILETADGYNLEFAVPGLKKEDLKIQLDDDILTISMEKQSETNNKDDKNYIRKEFNYTGFTQSLILPENVKKDNITANVENGVLHVAIPKIAQNEIKQKSKVIEIQ